MAKGQLLQGRWGGWLQLPVVMSLSYGAKEGKNLRKGENRVFKGKVGKFLLRLLGNWVFFLGRGTTENSIQKFSTMVGAVQWGAGLSICGVESRKTAKGGRKGEGRGEMCKGVNETKRDRLGRKRPKTKGYDRS